MQQNYLREFTSQNVRPDGRQFSAARPVAVLPSIFTRNSHGSAMVTLGSNSEKSGGCTRVVAACTLLVGHPSPATPREGDIDVALTASPASGPRFDLSGRESGDVSSGNLGMGTDGSDRPPLPGNLSHVVTNVRDASTGTNTNPSPTDVKEIESWIRRTLRASRYVDPRELGIAPGTAAWRVRVSIRLLNHEGNVWDAAMLCACAALADLRLPMVEIERGAVRIVQDEAGAAAATKGKAQRRKGRSLTLGPLPVPLTMAILPTDAGEGENVLLVDPTHLEEDVAAGNAVTVVCNAREEIVEWHKKGSGSRLSVGQIRAVACMGFGRAKELETLVTRR